MLIITLIKQYCSFIFIKITISRSYRDIVSPYRPIKPTTFCDIIVCPPPNRPIRQIFVYVLYATSWRLGQFYIGLDFTGKRDPFRPNRYYNTRRESGSSADQNQNWGRLHWWGDWERRLHYCASQFSAIASGYVPASACPAEHASRRPPQMPSSIKPNW